MCESRVEMLLENAHGEQELEVSFNVGPGFRTETQHFLTVRKTLKS